MKNISPLSTVWLRHLLDGHLFHVKVPKQMHTALATVQRVARRNGTLSRKLKKNEFEEIETFFLYFPPDGVERPDRNGQRSSYTEPSVDKLETIYTIIFT